MSRDFRAVVDKIIHPRFTNIRRRVRKALDRAYQDGLNDAAVVVEEAADILAYRVRELRTDAGTVGQRAYDLGTVRPAGLQ